VTSYLALLRGINVGGKKKVPMKELRDLVEGSGFEDVSTFLQSGNLLLKAGSTGKEKLAAGLEASLKKTFGFDIAVMLRTQADLRRVLKGDPFGTKEADYGKVHVVFLEAPASPSAVKKLDPDRSPPDEFVVKRDHIYMRFPNGSGRSKLTLDYFERLLGTRGTARNLRTVTKALELMS
jgi:uncharacterized protein (DUF1697 family)